MISFCIGTSNNLEYLKLAVQSVRENSHYYDAPLLVFAENCTDGTYEWLRGENTYGVQFFIANNEDEGRKGIGGGMNFLADQVETKYIMFMHADMVAAPDWDKAAVDYAEARPDEKLWVSSQRIQPNVFNEPSRPGTLIVPREFGDTAETFDMDKFKALAAEVVKQNKGFTVRKGEGVSGLVRKDVWDEIGGNDPRFNPLAYDDMDLFIRMQNAGVDFPLIVESIVYHFGSRSDNGHFQDDQLKRSQRQINYEARSRERFVEKWGQLPEFDHYGFVKPIKEKE